MFTKVSLPLCTPLSQLTSNVWCILKSGGVWRTSEKWRFQVGQGWKGWLEHRPKLMFNSRSEERSSETWRSCPSKLRSPATRRSLAAPGPERGGGRGSYSQTTVGSNNFEYARIMSAREIQFATSKRINHSFCPQDQLNGLSFTLLWYSVQGTRFVRVKGVVIS